MHSIVIIGASFGGIPAAHGLLKDVIPALAVAKSESYKVTMIAPSSYFYFKVGAPRVIVNPSALPTDKALLSIPESFKKYSKEQFEFIEAYATSINSAKKVVEISAKGSPSSVAYDTLLIASGVTFSSPLWTNSSGTDVLESALKDIHARLPAASTVMVVGGGPAGVETAGELGQTYGGKKEITILSGSSSLLPRLKNKAVGKDAEARLTKQGVKVVHSIKVSGTTEAGGKTTVQLSDGSQKVVDVYIDATGDKPNSKFVPEAWLDAKGYVKTVSTTLRLDVPGVKNVYCIGSVGSYSNGGIMDVKFANKPLLESMKFDLMGEEPAKRKNLFKRITEADMQFVPIGSTQGVGAVFGHKIPSFMVTQIKSKTFMIGEATKMMAGA